MSFRTRLQRRFGDSLSPNANTAYLSYYDILLTYEDIRCLKNDWLTDMNIAFWEEWIEREILPRYPEARVVLLRPSMSFMLAVDPDLASLRSALPDLTRATHIFLPINDNLNPMAAEGGTHWSLLLVSRTDGVAFHYDSLGASNLNVARSICRILSKLLMRPLEFHHLRDTPQQANGSDCGVFVCILMRHLLVKRLLIAPAHDKVHMNLTGQMVDARRGRKEMLSIIESFRKEGERRRSRSMSPRHGKDRSPPRIE